MKSYVAYLMNPFLRHYAEIGGEEIIDPHLGPLSHLGGKPTSWRFGDPQADPEPDPWRAAIAGIVQAVQLRELASKLANAKLKEEMTKNATATIQSILDDDICPRPPKWPFPGPPPWPWAAVSELTLIANLFPAGAVQDGLMNVAADIVQRSATSR